MARVTVDMSMVEGSNVRQNDSKITYERRGLKLSGCFKVSESDASYRRVIVPN